MERHYGEGDTLELQEGKPRKAAKSSKNQSPLYDPSQAIPARPPFVPNHPWPSVMWPRHMSEDTILDIPSLEDTSNIQSHCALSKL